MLIHIIEFQSTLPHGERLTAVAAGANLKMFQSTLPHGERPYVERQLARTRGFNPRSHMGSDQAGLSLSDLHSSFQSTLPHGERRRAITSHTQSGVFQSTLPHGERRPNEFHKIAMESFNPRSHMGSDRTKPTTRTTKNCFNPRSHMGSDQFLGDLNPSVPVSIHAPTWGATSMYDGIGRSRMFQSTLPHGERHIHISHFIY